MNTVVESVIRRLETACPGLISGEGWHSTGGMLRRFCDTLVGKPPDGARHRSLGRSGGVPGGASAPSTLLLATAGDLPEAAPATLPAAVTRVLPGELPVPRALRGRSRPAGPVAPSPDAGVAAYRSNLRTSVAAGQETSALDEPPTSRPCRIGARCLNGRAGRKRGGGGRPPSLGWAWEWERGHLSRDRQRLGR